MYALNTEVSQINLDINNEIGTLLSRDLEQQLYTVLSHQFRMSHDARRLITIIN